jgi:hypothetical protein
MVVLCPVMLHKRPISLSSVTSDSTVTPSSVDVATGRAARCVPVAGNARARDCQLLLVDTARPGCAVGAMVDGNGEVFVVLCRVVRSALVV